MSRNIVLRLFPLLLMLLVSGCQPQPVVNSTRPHVTAPGLRTVTEGNKQSFYNAQGRLVATAVTTPRQVHSDFFEVKAGPDCSNCWQIALNIQDVNTIGTVFSFSVVETGQSLGQYSTQGLHVITWNCAGTPQGTYSVNMAYAPTFCSPEGECSGSVSQTVGSGIKVSKACASQPAPSPSPSGSASPSPSPTPSATPSPTPSPSASVSPSPSPSPKVTLPDNASDVAQQALDNQGIQVGISGGEVTDPEFSIQSVVPPGEIKAGKKIFYPGHGRTFPILAYVRIPSAPPGGIAAGGIAYVTVEQGSNTFFTDHFAYHPGLRAEQIFYWSGLSNNLLVPEGEYSLVLRLNSPLSLPVAIDKVTVKHNPKGMVVETFEISESTGLKVPVEGVSCLLQRVLTANNLSPSKVSVTSSTGFAVFPFLQPDNYKFTAIYGGSRRTVTLKLPDGKNAKISVEIQQQAIKNLNVSFF